MVETEWFRVQRDRDAVDIRGAQDFTRKRYPYFMDRAAFDSLDDDTAFYEYAGRKEVNDMIFEPTFRVSDGFQSIFHYLEPEMEFKSVHLLDESRKEGIPAPLYWIPFLPFTDAIHENTRVLQGKAAELVLKKEALAGHRILHCRLPAEDLWLFSLEAAECILRRSPMGIGMAKVTKYL